MDDLDALLGAFYRATVLHAGDPVAARAALAAAVADDPVVAKAAHRRLGELEGLANACGGAASLSQRCLISAVSLKALKEVLA